MDFGHNIILNYSKPKNLEHWKATKVSIETKEKDSYFKMTKDSVLTQNLLGQDIKYMPKKYKVTMVATVPKNTTYFTQSIHGHLIMYRKDLTVSCYNIIFSPPGKDIIEKQIFTCYIDVKPSPEVTSATFILEASNDVIIYSITLQPSIDIDPSIQESIQNSLPSLIYYYNHYNTVIENEPTAIVFIKFGLAASANLAFNLFIQGIADVLTKDKPAFIQIKLLLNNAELPYSPLIAPVVFDRIVLGAPLTLTKLQAGANTLSIVATAINSKIIINPNGLQLTISGKNIEGGMGTEPPHAEIENTLLFKNINPEIYKNISSIVTTSFNSDCVSEAISNILDINMFQQTKSIKDSISIDIVRYGEIVSINNMQQPDSMIISGDGMKIEYDNVGNIKESTLFGGHTYTGSIQTEKFKIIENVSWW